MEHHQQIVSILEAVRDERGIPKAELARRAEVDGRRLMLILEGKRQLRADEFVRLIVVLGMGAKQFISREMLERYEANGKRMLEDFGPGSAGAAPACETADADGASAC